MEAILCKPLVVVCSELVNTRGCMYVESHSRLAVHCCENCTKLEVGDKSTSLVFFCAARNHMPAVYVVHSSTDYEKLLDVVE